MQRARLLVGLLLGAALPLAAAEGGGNAWCPVTGRRVDPALPPVAVAVSGPEGARTVAVRVADADAAQVLVRANAAQRLLFVQAAERGMRVEGGRLVALPPGEAAGR